MSDARLSELLSRDGIRIARRTVAKYREELRLPASSIRKVESVVAAVPAASEGAEAPGSSEPEPSPEEGPEDDPDAALSEEKA